MKMSSAILGALFALFVLTAPGLSSAAHADPMTDDGGVDNPDFYSQG